MDILEALFLGLVQGITEWIPVSSSGHLVLTQEFLGMHPSDNVLFDLILHAATLVSVSVFLRRELNKILRAMFVHRSRLDDDGLRARRLGWLALLATIPAAGTGILMDAYREQIISALATAIALLFTGTLLWLAEMPRLVKNRKQPGTRDAIIIGLFQAFSVIPGISRSGSTISSGCYLGLAREMVAIFSFLLSIPLILASLVYGAVFIDATTVDWTATLSAALVAAVSGFIAIKWLFEIIKKRKLRVFSIYCWVLGGIVLIYLLL